MIAATRNSKNKHMKTLKYSAVLILTIAALVSYAADSHTKAQTLKKFTATDETISKDLKASDSDGWQGNSEKGQVFRLFEVADPGVENCRIIYRAKIKSEDLSEPAYLEMWCRFPGKGEFFSRGLDHQLTGSNGWATYETPFFLKKGEKPDLIKLNLVVKGSGKVWIKDVELLKAPLSHTAK
jgi:hypothetical protein